MRSFSQSALFGVVLICSTSFGSSTGNNWESCPGSDWIQYNDEKCFKILDDTLRTFDDAKDACTSQEHISTLAVIQSQEEQRFLSNYLFKKEQKVDNFWIGLKFDLQNRTYVWVNDNSTLNYTNWDIIPRNRSNYCAHMQADEAVVGKWKDGPCEKKNAVLCQRMQFWSHELLQKTFLDSRKVQQNALEDAISRIQNLTKSLEKSNQRIEEQNQNFKNFVNQKVEELSQNFDQKINEEIQGMIPIGFIFTQMPNEKAPTEFWPWMVWTDVSSAYAGTFFRVEGGGSAAFGTEQPENVPRITHVQNDGINCYNDGTIETVVGGWSRMIYSGDFGKGMICLRFQMSGGEVRPRNMAVRVWKRTG